MGRAGVRVSAVVGCILLVVASIGWWLDTRVIDDAGLRRRRDPGVAAPGRCATTSPTRRRCGWRGRRTSSPRRGPAVTDAVSAAINTPPVADAIRDFAAAGARAGLRGPGRAAGRHRRAADRDLGPLRAAVDQPRAGEEAAGERARRVGHDLAERRRRRPVPAERLDLALDPDRRSSVSLLLVRALRRAADQVRGGAHRRRRRWPSRGAILAGFGAAAPVVGGDRRARRPAARATRSPSSSSCSPAGSPAPGLALILFGLALALAPAADGGDLGDRWRRLRAWVAAKRTQPRWRFAGGVALVLVAVSFLTRPASSARTLVVRGGGARRLRRRRRLPARRRRPPHRPRHPGAAQGAGSSSSAATMVVRTLGSAPARSRRWPAATTKTPKANEARHRGATATSSCARQPFDQIVWPASHNAMSSSAYNFLGAEHTITIPEQLIGGARFLMLDVYYGYDDNGLVRTNLAGGVDRSSSRRSGARRRSTRCSASARSPAPPTRRATSRSSTSATTCASSAR